MSEVTARTRESHWDSEPLPQHPEVGKKQIESGEWAECWICFKEFGRQRRTNQYCHHCRRGFCEGEHGSWQGVAKGKSRPLCVVCRYRLSARKPDDSVPDGLLMLVAETSGDYFLVHCKHCKEQVDIDTLNWVGGVPVMEARCSSCGLEDRFKLRPAKWQALLSQA